MSNTANKLVNLIRELTQEQLESLDQTAFCQVQSVNADGTVNVYILPDTENVIYNIINESRFTLSERDICVLYKIGNKLNNAFIVAKCGVGNAGVVTSTGVRSSSGSGGGGGSSSAVTGVKGSAESSYRIGNVDISAENIGLGNVNNTSDLDKPISRAAQAALNNKLNQVTSQQGQALYGVNGSSQTMITAGSNITIEDNKINAINTGVTGVKGCNETNYRTGNVDITAANIGLGNVDNTSDLNKPISTATQTALDNKLDKSTNQQGQALYGVSGSTQVMIKAGANITIENNEISATGGGTSARVENNILYI